MSELNTNKWSLREWVMLIQLACTVGAFVWGVALVKGTVDKLSESDRFTRSELFRLSEMVTDLRLTVRGNATIDYRLNEIERRLNLLDGRRR